MEVADMDSKFEVELDAELAALNAELADLEVRKRAIIDQMATRATMTAAPRGIASLKGDPARR
jgi:hypothetical protein